MTAEFIDQNRVKGRLPTLQMARDRCGARWKRLVHPGPPSVPPIAGLLVLTCLEWEWLRAGVVPRLC